LTDWGFYERIWVVFSKPRVLSGFINEQTSFFPSNFRLDCFDRPGIVFLFCPAPTRIRPAGHATGDHHVLVGGLPALCPGEALLRRSGKTAPSNRTALLRSQFFSGEPGKIHFNV